MYTSTLEATPLAGKDLESTTSAYHMISIRRMTNNIFRQVNWLPKMYLLTIQDDLYDQSQEFLSL